MLGVVPVRTMLIYQRLAGVGVSVSDDMQRYTTLSSAQHAHTRPCQHRVAEVSKN